MKGGILVGIKDVNLEILSKIDDDKDLFNFCLSSKSANILCQDDNFWRKRFEKKFGDIGKEAMKYKSGKRNWKNQYLKVVYDLSEYSNYPFHFFDNLRWRIELLPTPKNVVVRQLINKTNQTYENVKISKASEEVKHQYWLLNVGTKINISYPIDRYEELVNEVREYDASNFNLKYFTPHQVLNLVYNFYQEKITGDQLEDLQEAEVEYADDFTVEQAESGEVRRVNLMGSLTCFEGFVHDAERDVYYLTLGS